MRGGYENADHINWTGGVYRAMRNWTLKGHKSNVAFFLKDHYKKWLLLYEKEHPQDVTKGTVLWWSPSRHVLFHSQASFRSSLSAELAGSGCQIRCGLGNHSRALNLPAHCCNHLANSTTSDRKFRKSGCKTHFQHLTIPTFLTTAVMLCEKINVMSA